MLKYARKISSFLILSVFLFMPFLNNHYIFYGTYAVKEVFLCLAALIAAVVTLPKILSGKEMKINPYIIICALFVVSLILSGAGNITVNRTIYTDRIIIWASLLFLTAVCAMPSAGLITAAIVLSNLAVVAAGIAQVFLFYSGNSFNFFGNDEFGKRIFSIFGNPDIFAAYLIAVIPMIFYSYKLTGRKVLAALVIINVLLVFLTQSAAALSVISIMFLLWCLRNFRGRKRILTAGIALIIIAGGIFWAAGQKKDSVVLRRFLWESSVKMAFDNPVFGAGAGNFRILGPAYQAKVLKQGGYPGYVATHDEAYVHNDFLQSLSETGIAGVLIFLVFLFYPFYIYFRNKSGKPEDGYIVFSMAGIILFSTANFPFEMPLIAAMYMIFAFKLTIQTKIVIEKPGLLLKSGAAAAAFCVISANIFFIPDYLERGYMEAYLGYASAKQLKVNYAAYDIQSARDYQISFYIGIMKNSEGDFNGAIKSYIQALKLFPGFVGCIYNLGNAYFNSGDYQTAGLCYRKIIGLNRVFIPAYNNLAIIEKKNNNYKDAVMLLLQADKLSPNMPEVNYNLADAYYHEGDTKKAEVYLKKTLQIKADYQPALMLAQMMKLKL